MGRFTFGFGRFAWLGLAGLGGVAGCMFGPYDGQTVASSTSAVYPWGVYAGAGAPVTFEAKAVADGQFYAVANTTTTTSTYTAFGSSWNYWSTSGVVPSTAWRSGAAGKRAEVRTRSGTSQLYSFPASGLGCMLDQDAAHVDASTAAWTCAADRSPSAFLFTADYRGLPTFTPQSPIDYPQELVHDRAEESQGAASTATDWFFTRNNSSQLLKIPIASDLASGTTWSNAAAVGMPSAVSAAGYNHFGDPDAYDGNVYVPLEGPALGGIAQFDTNLNYRGYATLAGPKAPWVAIDPTTGLLYTSAFCDVREVDVYTMTFAADGTLNGLWFTDHRTLWNPNSAPITLQQVQGGAFSSRGNLYLVSDAKNSACATAGTSGIYGFEGATMRKEFYAYVAYDTGYDEELEGIDIRDVTGLGTPGITGQLHLVMLDNDTFDSDDLYFKHYAAPASELGFL